MPRWQCAVLEGLLALLACSCQCATVELLFSILKDAGRRDTRHNGRQSGLKTLWSEPDKAPSQIADH